MEWIKHLCIVILFCATNVLSQENCPEKCVCIRGSTVRCMFLQLDRVPSGIPPTTTVLYVYKLIFFFKFSSLVHTQVVIITLTNTYNIAEIISR